MGVWSDPAEKASASVNRLTTVLGVWAGSLTIWVGVAFAAPIVGINSLLIMAEESDLDISTLQIQEDNMDLDCESWIQALAFYGKIVEQTDNKEIKKIEKSAPC
ncbi:hypothetical protein CDAR_443081 [Caerostris darwini]|uniref:Uncharacterized protein n=1 Tax=Caerostris darwini TaxID=1538125 RepID=A0AAV4MYG1_9ARAC|nr:hypothetical protein CDAR_443081 [Caerostris darwini]